MAQPKGQTGNPNGRPKGSPNKITKETREVIKALTTEYFNNGSFDNDFKKLDPKDRVLIMEKLLKYHIPTLSAVDAKVYTNEEIGEKVKSMTDQQFFDLCDAIIESNDKEEAENES